MVGNPGPDLIGDDRGGDNLYADSVVALDPKTGALKWHFQFTPHDVWDYDAQETPALVDATWRGAPAPGSGQSQWLPVRARSDERPIPVRPAIREERDLGERSHG